MASIGTLIMPGCVIAASAVHAPPQQVRASRGVFKRTAEGRIVKHWSVAE